MFTVGCHEFYSVWGFGHHYHVRKHDFTLKPYSVAHRHEISSKFTISNRFIPDNFQFTELDHLGSPFEALLLRHRPTSNYLHNLDPTPIRLLVQRQTAWHSESADARLDSIL